MAELARLHRIVEDEYRRALHVFLDHRRPDAAALVEQPHAAVVAGDQRALGGRERNVEVALGVLAVDPQRTGQADRHLGHADEILDVAGQHAGIERVGPTCELGAGVLADELAPLRRHGGV